MNRNISLATIQSTATWDLVIIGGGATGLGIAVDAAKRGYKTLLIEKNDFSKGTSSRSTKLIHGGVRYLAQANFSLVRHALRERSFFLHNAPHTTNKLMFIVPVYSIWKKIFYGFGLYLYQWMSGTLNIGKTNIISRKKTKELLPTIQTKKLKGAICYYDGQFDDARMCIDLAHTATQLGATVVNYMACINFIKKNDHIVAIQYQDMLQKTQGHLFARCFINATGVFAESLLDKDYPLKHPHINPSQGVHLVIEKKLFPSSHALMIPHTTDGRVLFAVPWHSQVIIGTTDTPISTIDEEPRPLEEEINFIIDNFNQYTETPIQRKDIVSYFAGLRPLVNLHQTNKTSTISRDHTIFTSPSSLITITGGKWTTYRLMAEEVLNKAISCHLLTKKSCETKHLQIQDPKQTEAYKQLAKQHPEWLTPLSTYFPYQWIDIYFAIRFEMAITLEDVMLRRTRMFILNSSVASSFIDPIAHILMHELHLSIEEIEKQKNIFKQFIDNHYTMQLS